MILLKQLLSEAWPFFQKKKPRVPQTPNEIEKIANAVKSMQGVRPNSIVLKPIYSDDPKTLYLAFRLDDGQRASVVKTTAYYIFFGTDLVFKHMSPDEIIKFLQNNL